MAALEQLTDKYELGEETCEKVLSMRVTPPEQQNIGEIFQDLGLEKWTLFGMLLTAQSK